MLSRSSIAEAVSRRKRTQELPANLGDCAEHGNGTAGTITQLCIDQTRLYHLANIRLVLRSMNSEMPAGVPLYGKQSFLCAS